MKEMPPFQKPPENPVPEKGPDIGRAARELWDEARTRSGNQGEGIETAWDIARNSPQARNDAALRTRIREIYESERQAQAFFRKSGPRKSPRRF